MEDVGEGWLRDLLELNLSDAESASAASGWDGGQYRAWGDDDHTAVVMQTAWDSEQDAAEFASAMDRWLKGRATSGIERTGATVQLLFASDPSTLSALQTAAA